jgi:acetyl esterase/lipase
MRKGLLILLMTGTALVSNAAEPGETGESPSVGGWQPPPGAMQMPIWPGTAPGVPEGNRSAESVFEVKKVPGRHYQGIANVSTPTMTIFRPAAGNNGAALVVFPGGGFRILAIDIEGTEVCEWVTSIGATCVLLKYRVPGGNHYWDPELGRHVTPAIPFALQDAQRAIRLVRYRAAGLGIDPRKVGVFGFSAGGYLVAQTSNIVDSAYDPMDAADEVSSRPDFAIALYPGHLCRSGGMLDPDIHVTKQAPPTFLLQAWNDPVDRICNSTLYARALDEAGASAEVHLFAGGGHAFGMREASGGIAAWPSLVENWLKGIGMLGEAKPPLRDGL